MAKRAFLVSIVSLIISKQVFTKYKGPRCPIISIVIGHHTIHRALLNLGASVNLLPLQVFERPGELKPTKMVLQLVNFSTRVPSGMVEDVSVKVGKFIFSYA